MLGGVGPGQPILVQMIPTAELEQLAGILPLGLPLLQKAVVAEVAELARLVEPLEPLQVILELFMGLFLLQTRGGLARLEVIKPKPE